MFTRWLQSRIVWVKVQGHNKGQTVCSGLTLIRLLCTKKFFEKEYSKICGRIIVSCYLFIFQLCSIKYNCFMGYSLYAFISITVTHSWNYSVCSSLRLEAIKLQINSEYKYQKMCMLTLIANSVYIYGYTCVQGHKVKKINSLMHACTHTYITLYIFLGCIFA